MWKRHHEKKGRRTTEKQTWEKVGESEEKQADYGLKRQKYNNKGDSRKTCQKKNAIGVEDSGTTSTGVTTRDTHWDMGSGGEKGTVTTVANSTLS